MKKKDYTDIEIIEGCSKGSIRFQELLYRRFFAFAMSVCIRYNPNREDSLEVLNDSFMKVFDNISELDTSRPFKSWFRKILVNTSIDRYRSNRRFVIPVDVDVAGLEIADHAPFSRKLDGEELIAMLSALPDLYRMIFNLYEVEGYSHDEIAGMLDIAPGTSRSHLSRARALLRKIYTENNQKTYYEAI